MNFYFALFGSEVKLECDLIICIVIFKFHCVCLFVFIFLFISPFHEKALSNPFDISSISLYASEAYSALNFIIEFCLDESKFPKLEESDFESSCLIHLGGVAGMYEKVAVYLSIDDVFSFEVIEDGLSPIDGYW